MRVLDGHRLALPDLSGNNLLDSLINLTGNGHVGLLFLIPGRDETLRVDGRAWVTVDPAVLELWDAELARPKTAIGVEVHHAFIHCAKSFRRGRVWDASSWVELTGAPDACELLISHVGLEAEPRRGAGQPGGGLRTGPGGGGGGRPVRTGGHPR